MDANSRWPKRQDGVISSLNVAIEAMNLAKEASSLTPAKAVFGSASVLVTMIRVCFLFWAMNLGLTCDQDSVANKAGYVELGLTCANVCSALDQGLEGKNPDDINQYGYEAIGQLTT